MTQPAYSIRQARCTDLAAKEVRPVQRRVLRIEPEDGNSQLVRSESSVRKDTATDEYQGGTTISDRDRGSTFHEFDVEVAATVIDPTEIARGVQVTRPSSLDRREDRVASTEIDHPSTTEFYSLGVIRTPRHRFRKQRVHVHDSRLHPTAEIAAMSVGTGS